jgi:Transcriptional regulators
MCTIRFGQFVTCYDRGRVATSAVNAVAKTAAERMANLRARQRQSGLVTLTLVVPQTDSARFTALARTRRELKNPQSRAPSRAVSWPGGLATMVRRSAIRPRDILKLRELLEVAAVGLVIGRLNRPIARRLETLVEGERGLDGDASSDDLQRLHATLADLTGDAALRFLLGVALRLTDDHASFRRQRREEREAAVARIKRLHAGIVAAILQRRQPLAEARMRRYVAGLEAWLD